MAAATLSSPGPGGDHATMCENQSAGATPSEGALRFLASREQVIHLAPLEASAAPGYVWRRVFLRRRAASLGVL